MPDSHIPPSRSRAAWESGDSPSQAGAADRPEGQAEIDELDRALDRLAAGSAITPDGQADPDRADLVATAAWVQRIDADTQREVLPGGGLDDHQKAEIWATILRERERPATIPEPDARPARSAARLGIVATPPTPLMHAGRPLIPAWIRSRVDLQPAITVLLVAALLVAIVAGFRSFGGAGGSLVTPTASAHEAEGFMAVASPDATAMPVACTTEHRALGAGNRAPYGYEKRGPVSDEQRAQLPDVLARFAACMYGPNFDGLAQVATWRYVTGLQSGLAGTPADISGATHRAEAIQHLWMGPIPATSEPLRLVWTASNGEQLNLNIFLDTAQRLSDGRIGVLATIAPMSLSPIPDDAWIRQGISTMLSVWFIGVQETSAGPLVDEMFGMCGGSDCVPMFGGGAATPGASPTASPVASPVATSNGRLAVASKR